MNFDDYQREAATTAVYSPRWSTIYPALGLVSEAGEVAGKVKKVLRDHGGDYDRDSLVALNAELGDVLWYVAVLADDLGLSLDDIAQDNLNKLRDRANRGVLGGSGDGR